MNLASHTRMRFQRVIAMIQDSERDIQNNLDFNLRAALRRGAGVRKDAQSS